MQLHLTSLRRSSILFTHENEFENNARMSKINISVAVNATMIINFLTPALRLCPCNGLIQLHFDLVYFVWYPDLKK